MKEFIKYLAKQIVTLPEEIEVIEEKQDGYNTYKIKSNQEDIKILIGKSGNIIKSIRNLAKAKAIKDNEMIKIVIEDETHDAI